MNQLINQQLQPQRAQLDEIAKDLHELTIQIGHNDLTDTLSELRNRLHEPFMFVIVGEVKAGKSSFINALLATGREITKVAPQPMTDTIQQILYGEQEEIVTINPYLKQIFLPVEILREIAIVDTPGTNTIVEHHQEITERFIPSSDLIVFVFEAKNPYRQSAWAFFDFINAEWRRKIVFILQQKDLMREEDLKVNIQGVIDQAAKKGIKSPLVFAVSALQEEEGHPESGFEPVRQFIRQNITGGKAPVLKLLNSIDTLQNINQRINEGLVVRQKQWDSDTAFRQDIMETLENQEGKSHKQVNVLVENLIAAYDRTTNQKELELKNGLSFFGLLKRSITSIFNRKQSVKDWLEEMAKSLESGLNKELTSKLNESVIDLSDNVQQMAKIIDLKIRNSTTILKNDHELFSDIAEKRSSILRDLQETFQDFISKTENFTDESLFPDKQTISPNLATGSGVAAIGVILMTVTNGIVFDITGGILTTIGLLFAGVSTSVQKRKILDGFRKEVNKGRDRIEEDVTEKLRTYISRLKDKIDQNFHRFDELLKNEEQTIIRLKDQWASIHQRLNMVHEKLKNEHGGGLL
ncbi:MAG: dynamin family protein [Saprospiraceae bacterium]